MTANVQVSAKLADGKIYVVGGDTVLDFQNNLIELLGAEGAGDLMDEFKTALTPIGAGGMEQAMQNVTATFGAPAPVPTTAPANVDGPRTETDKWNNVYTYGAGGPSCPHGERARKQGVSKASGKSYSAWVCPTQTPVAYRQKVTPDKTCQPEWIQ